MIAVCESDRHANLEALQSRWRDCGLEPGGLNVERVRALLCGDRYLHVAAVAVGRPRCNLRLATPECFRQEGKNQVFQLMTGPNLRRRSVLHAIAI